MRTPGPGASASRALARGLGLAALLACSCRAPGDPGGPAGGPDGRPVRVSSAGDAGIWLCVGPAGGVARDADATLEWDEDAVMGVVVRKAGRWYTDLDRVEIGGAEIGAHDGMEALPGWTDVRWYRVESGDSSYRNSDRNEGWWADVTYVESLAASGRATTMPADVRPSRRSGVEWKGRWVGTMRWKVAIGLGDVLLATPGAESAGKGGATPGVRRVSRLGGTGWPAVDRALALANLPYIWGSAPLGSGAATHQAESFVGADCADLVVAAWHASGASQVPYTAVIPMIEKYAKAKGAVALSGVEGGQYVDGGRRSVRVGDQGITPGSAILWRFGPGQRKGHAAVLVEDSGPAGVPDGYLGEDDLVIHAMWDEPRVQAIRDVLPGLSPVMALPPVVMP